MLPHWAIVADTALLLRVLRVLATGAEEPAVKLVLVVGRTPAAVAEAADVVVLVIRNIHLILTSFTLVAVLDVSTCFAQLCICSPLKEQSKGRACAQPRGSLLPSRIRGGRRLIIASTILAYIRRMPWTFPRRFAHLQHQ